MSNENIGEKAGKIWQTLKENGAMHPTALKKTTKLSDKDVFMGIGWLAREGKLSFEQTKDQPMINLTET